MSPVDDIADGVQLQQSRQDRILNAALNVFAQRGRNCQYLWIGVFQATSVPAC